MTNVLPMHENLDADPDVVAYAMQLAMQMVPGIQAEQAKAIEAAVKNKYGGRRFYIPKGVKHSTPEQRQAVFRDGLTNMPTKDIEEKHKVSRATIYRLMKQGGGRFS